MVGWVTDEVGVTASCVLFDPQAVRHNRKNIARKNNVFIDLMLGCSLIYSQRENHIKSTARVKYL